MQHPQQSLALALALALRGLIAATAAAALAACQSPIVQPRQPAPAAQTAAPAPAAAFDTWADAQAADWMRLSPERAIYSQYFSGAEQAAIERELTPRTRAQRDRSQALARSGLAQLTALEAGTLTPEQRLNAALWRWSLQRTLDDTPFADHFFAFNQLGGPQVALVQFLSEAHPLRNADDVAAFLARLAQVDTRLDEATVLARDAAAKGLLPPRFIVERARSQVEAFLQPAPADNVLVQALARRSALIAGLAEDTRRDAIATATATVASRVRPAYARVLALLNDLHPRTTDDAGLWRLPDGAAAYAQALAGNTTTTLSADEIHAIGLREVARIRDEMDTVLRTMGRADGSVEARMQALGAALQPPAEPDPRPALLARYAEFVRDAQRRSTALFNLQPKAPVEVRREPALTERTAAAHYSTPAPDGSLPGIFWVPLPGPTFAMARMRALAVHEAVPGHHFQLALQQEQAGLPVWRQRRVISGGSAFTEGWALYAERLAIDEGWYTDDPVGLLGALDSQLFRARRLVVDTGLHAKRWTRRQAIDYGISAQEVERYVANPGQACAYMIGMLRILALRDGARAALGSRFSLPAFHDVVLQTGSVPLDVLGDVVRGWSAAQTTAQTQTQTQAARP